MTDNSILLKSLRWFALFGLAVVLAFFVFRWVIDTNTPTIEPVDHAVAYPKQSVLSNQTESEEAIESVDLTDKKAEVEALDNFVTDELSKCEANPDTCDREELDQLNEIEESMRKTPEELANH